MAIRRSDVIQKAVINVENRLKFSIKSVRSISSKMFIVGGNMFSLKTGKLFLLFVLFL